MKYAEVMIAASAMLAFAAGCGGKSASTGSTSDTPTTNTPTTNTPTTNTPTTNTPNNSNPTSGQTVTVSGVVLDEDGNPITAEAVLVPGLTPVATDDAGKFSIAGVTTPYDLVVIKGNTKTAFIYKGLTRADPTVFMWTQEDDQTRLATRSAHVYGNVYGGTDGFITGTDDRPAFINFASKEINQWYDPDSQSGVLVAGEAKGNGYFDDLELNGPITTTGNFFGLQYERDPISGLPLLYWSDFQPGATILAGQPFDANYPFTTGIKGPSLFLRPSATDTVQGTVATPGQYTVNDKFVGLQFPGGINFFVFQDTFGPATRTFNYIVPDLVGATTQVCAKASDNLFSGAMSVTCDTVTNDDGVMAVNIREAPEPFVPANGGVGCSFKTLFQWTKFAGGIHVVKFAPDRVFDSVGSYNPKFVIITADASVSIPDLRSVGLGIIPSSDYSWVVRGTGPFSSIDAFATYPVAVPPFNMAPVGTGNLTAPIPEAFWAKSQKYHFTSCGDACFN